MALVLFWASIALLVFLAVLSFDIMGFFSRKNHFPVDGRVGGIIYDANLAELC
jgi:3-dehydrosphinganine reductase